jgi:hypothetical protein
VQAQPGQPPGRGEHGALASQAPGTPGLGGAAVAGGGAQQFFLTGFHQGVVDVHDWFLPADGAGRANRARGPGSRPGLPGWPLVVGVFFRLVSGSAAGVGTTMRNRPQDYSQKSREATAAIAAFAQYTHRHA